MRLNNQRVLWWGLWAALGVALVAEVLPFLLPFEPQALPPVARSLEKAARYAHPIPVAALASRVVSGPG